MPQSLSSTTNTTGSFHTAARLRDSWKAPWLAAPSPVTATAMRISSPAREGERLTQGRWVTLGDDAGAAEVGVGVEQVHVPAAALAEPGLAAEDLGGELAQVHAVGDRQVVRAVGRRHRVVRGQVITHAHGHRFLPRGEVHLPGISPAPMSHTGDLSA